MNCLKKLTLTGYHVRYVDLREPKPRPIREEVCALDKDGVDALALLGQNVADFITARYERGGYHVTGVERLTPRHTVMLDLSKIWEYAAAEAAAKSQSIVNLEGEQHG